MCMCVDATICMSEYATGDIYMITMVLTLVKQHCLLIAKVAYIQAKPLVFLWVFTPVKLKCPKSN